MGNFASRMHKRIASILHFVSCGWLAFPFALFAQTPSSQPWHPVIPKSWDAAELDAWTIPPRTPGVHTVHLPASFVYSIPTYPIYKTYPIYYPGKEPKGYMEWLSRQEPEITFNAAKLLSESDWIAAGRLVFEAPQEFEPADKFMDLEWYEELHVPLTSEGIVPGRRYVIRKKGVVEAAVGACVSWHSRVMPDGTLLHGPQTNFPYQRDVAWRMRKQNDIQAARGLMFGLYFPSWKPDSLADGIASKDIDEIARMHEAIPPGVNARIGVSLLSPPKVADLIGVKDRNYLDLIARVRHRSIGDLMRYVNFEPGEKAFFADRTNIPPEAIPAAESMYRYSDEQAFALALYIYSLQPPPNPNRMDSTAVLGQKLFEREGCAMCHTPPLYTNNKLTLAADFEPPAAHRARYDILDVRVGTDLRSAMLPMRGTGYYKVPSLKGLWYRGPLEHNGSVATLEDWFDSRRLQPDYVPTGFVGYGFKTRTVPGHPFGLKLSATDKKALIAFLRTL
jgi:hypothetical protein